LQTGGAVLDWRLAALIDCTTFIPSWNQIAAFLQSMQRLRDSVGFAA